MTRSQSFARSARKPSQAKPSRRKRRVSACWAPDDFDACLARLHLRTLLVQNCQVLHALTPREAVGVCHSYLCLLPVCALALSRGHLARSMHLFGYGHVFRLAGTRGSTRAQRVSSAKAYAQSACCRLDLTDPSLADLIWTATCKDLCLRSTVRGSS